MSTKNKIIDVAIEGNISELKSLLKKGGKVPKGILQKVIFSGWSQGENIKALEILVEAGADVNPSTGETPLYSAAMVGPFPSRSLSVTNFLLNNGANPNLKSEWEYPLHLAVTTIADKTVKRLIEGGANINAIADDGETVTHKCLNAYYEFIGDDFEDEDEKEEAMETAEMYVINVLDHLLLAKPDLSIQNNDGENPLTSVLTGIYPETIIQKLIDANAPANETVNINDNDINILGIALLQQYSSELILQIFKTGNDATTSYNLLGNESAITIVISEYPSELALEFLKFQPTLAHFKTFAGYSMLHVATQSGDNINLMKYLIEQGVDPSYTGGKNNKTALEYAEENGYENAIKFLKALK